MCGHPNNLFPNKHLVQLQFLHNIPQSRSAEEAWRVSGRAGDKDRQMFTVEIARFTELSASLGLK